MELQITDVQAALAKLLNHYPESGHNSATISRLAFDWHDLLVEDGVTRKQFSAGIRHAVKRCRFFPKLVDVLDGVGQYRERPPEAKATDSLQIAEYTANGDNLTPEEIERNNERIAMIKKVLTKEVSLEEAVEFIESTVVIKEFGNG